MQFSELWEMNDLSCGIFSEQRFIESRTKELKYFLEFWCEVGTFVVL